MLLFKSGVSLPRSQKKSVIHHQKTYTKPQLPARRKYGEATLKYGEAWRSVSAEPSYASSSLVQRSPSAKEDEPLQERSAWSGAAERLECGQFCVKAPQTAVPTNNVRQSRSSLSTADSAHNPVQLRGKQINSAHVKGVLSEWSTEFQASLVADTMHIIYDDQTETFHVCEEKRRPADDLQAEKRRKAHEIFGDIADRRGILGMCGDVGLGPEQTLIPETSAEKMLMTKPGRASCGPIHSYVTEPQPKTSEGKRGMLHFELLGPDEEEPNVFYFEQPDVVNPHRSGRLKWRLTCLVDRVWISPNVRPYGPSREWGGAWGGGNEPFKNSSTLNQPGNAKILGGHWQKIPRFIMHVVDEVSEKKDFRLPSPRLAHAATVSLPTSCTLPAFESTRQVPFQKHCVPRTFSGFRSTTSYCVQKGVQIGMPEQGYPGWEARNRAPQDLVQEVQLGSRTSQNDANTSLVDTAPSPPGKLINSSAGVRPIIEHEEISGSIAKMSNSFGAFGRLRDGPSPRVPRTILNRFGLLEEVHMPRIQLIGIPRNKSPDLMRREGAPSHFRANLESWRMPHAPLAEQLLPNLSCRNTLNYPHRRLRTSRTGGKLKYGQRIMAARLTDYFGSAAGLLWSRGRLLLEKYISFSQEALQTSPAQTFSLQKKKCFSC